MCKPAIGTGYVLGMPQDCNLAKRVNEVKSSGVEVPQDCKSSGAGVIYIYFFFNSILINFQKLFFSLP